MGTIRGLSSVDGTFILDYKQPNLRGYMVHGGWKVVETPKGEDGRETYGR